MNRVINAAKLLVRRCLSVIARGLLDASTGFLISSNPHWNPRIWSNREIRRIGPMFQGDILNVSAAQDEDKESPPQKYREYFPHARTYQVTNYGRGYEGSGIKGEYLLDLSVPYDGNFRTFDVVFNHTVLEHLADHAVAIDTICALSRDVVITVVPFLQSLHGRNGTYSDYWRYSPHALVDLFGKRGFEPLYVSWNEDFPIMNVYVLFIASRCPEKYRHMFPAFVLPRIGAEGPGVLFNRFLWGTGPSSTRMQNIGRWLGCRLITAETGTAED